MIDFNLKCLKFVLLVSVYPWRCQRLSENLENTLTMNGWTDCKKYQDRRNGSGWLRVFSRVFHLLPFLIPRSMRQLLELKIYDVVLCLISRIFMIQQWKWLHLVKKHCYAFSFPFFQCSFSSCKTDFATAYRFFKNSESVPFKDHWSLNGTPWHTKKKGQNDQGWQNFLVILPFGSSHKTSNVTSQYKKRKQK